MTSPFDTLGGLPTVVVMFEVVYVGITAVLAKFKMPLAPVIEVPFWNKSTFCVPVVPCVFNRAKMALIRPLKGTIAEVCVVG